ncbi:oligomeric Golgi complex subunit 6 [Mycotypha africana]|uniref:oligomeric Golgi complex subunit 6 n=1 Tax=Mycotypha africana TaxID=64632 RepID=UPI002301CECC|nr:oligomeric Golgi complex subunit 6 [Mycotypha africana]KAI8979432.1 oligomeric Golgi complex subunit 6 [Mycotypha africana]
METKALHSSTTPESPPSLSISNKPNKLLAAKLSKILYLSASEDTKIKSALTSLSNIPDLDETSLRHNLRGTLETKEVNTNRRFLCAFENVIKSFEYLETHVGQMENDCKEMKKRLQKVELQTANMIEQSYNMQERSASYTTQIHVADTFLQKFTLSEQEVKTLNSSSEPIDASFFDALEHLQQIHTDCQLLLTTKNQTAGRDIMQSLSQCQENAYDRLYKWTQYESRKAFSGDSIDVTSLLPKALRALMLRPVLFQTILDEIASARHDSVARAFMNALTRGGPGGTPRPIELQAPDPLRYVGDMLAWIHQACASEKEMLETLLTRNESKNEEMTETTLKIADAIMDLVDCAMEGTCRPLKSRMEQVLVLQPGAITSYKMANLIQFYTITLSKLMRKNATLERVLYEMTELAYKYFFKTINAQADRLMQSAEPPNRNLAVAPTIREMTVQLKEILASYDSSLIVTTNTTEGFPEFNFAETLDAIIEPLLNTCELSVAKFSKSDQEIYMLNCLFHIQSVLYPYEFTEKKRESINQRMTDLLNEIAIEEYNDLLKQAGLTEIKETITNKKSDVPLSSLPRMDVKSITDAMGKFDSFLVLIGADISTRLEKLSSTQHCQQVQSIAIRKLFDTYIEINEAVKDPKNGYENPDSILPRTIEDMEAIFSFALS